MLYRNGDVIWRLGLIYEAIQKILKSLGELPYIGFLMRLLWCCPKRIVIKSQVRCHQFSLSSDKDVIICLPLCTLSNSFQYDML